METVFINGATGFIGSYIVEAFAETGRYNLRVSDRPDSNFDILKKFDPEIMTGEIWDTDALEKQVAGVDIVINVAGIFDFSVPYETLDRVNHLGVHNICKATMKKAPNLKRFVQLSSVGCYGKPKTNPCKEDDPKRPRNNYEKTKWLGEQAAFQYHREDGLPVTAICPTLVYGPKSRYGHAMYISLLALQKARGMTQLKLPKRGPSNHNVHAADVGRGVVLLAEKEAAVGNRYNCVDKKPLSTPDFIGAMAEPLGIKVLKTLPYNRVIAYMFLRPVELLPDITGGFNRRLNKQWEEVKEEHGLTGNLTPRIDKDWIGYTMHDHVFDFTAIEDLGMEWKYPDFKEGIRETIEWYKENEWIP